jgi:hypothetical protein
MPRVVYNFLFDHGGPIVLVKEQASLPSARGDEIDSGLCLAMLGASHLTRG